MFLSFLRNYQVYGFQAGQSSLVIIIIKSVVIIVIGKHDRLLVEPKHWLKTFRSDTSIHCMYHGTSGIGFVAQAVPPEYVNYVDLGMT